MANIPPASAYSIQPRKCFMLAALLAIMGLMALSPSTARAATYIAINPDQPLRFGTIVVAQSGSRIVSSAGSITNINLMPVGANTAGPAQFTITYHRDPGANPPIILVTQIILANVPAFTQGNISGRLSGFDTDLPGNPTLTPGQSQTITWSLCLGTDCTMTFHVGGRLDITSAVGSGPITVSLPVTANVVAVL